MASVEENEPWLSSAIKTVKKTVDIVLQSGIAAENIYFLGFSQGACLATEYTTRYAKRYGGIVVFTGGLIGKEIDLDKYNGDFEQTPMFFGTSNPDLHIPVEKVFAFAHIAREMNANVTERVSENRGLNISEDEINIVNKIIFK